MVGNRLVIPIDDEIIAVHLALKATEMDPIKTFETSKKIALDIFQMLYRQTESGFVDILSAHARDWKKYPELLLAVIKMHDGIRDGLSELGKDKVVKHAHIPHDHSDIVIAWVYKDEEVRYGFDAYIEHLRSSGEVIDRTVEKLLRDWKSLRPVSDRHSTPTAGQTALFITS